MSTDTSRRPHERFGPARRTVKDLFEAAEKDTDAVSMFGDGTCWADTERAIFVVKGAERVRYLHALLVRQGLITEGKAVES